MKGISSGSVVMNPAEVEIGAGEPAGRRNTRKWNIAPVDVCGECGFGYDATPPGAIGPAICGGAAEVIALLTEIDDPARRPPGADGAVDIERQR